MTRQEREQLMAQYAAGYDQVVAALKGFPAGKLTARAIPGKWSAAEIVHHLADSETTSAIRIRKLMAEEHAIIQGYDQEAWATRFRYNERDIAPSLEAFRLARATTMQILPALSDADWAREGWHTDSGRYSAETWLEIYAVHAHNHAAQIARLRDAVGK
jgi:hypothetical protein